MIHRILFAKSKRFSILLSLFLSSTMLLATAAHADDEETSSLLRKALNPNNVDVTFSLNRMPLGFPTDNSIDFDKLETRLNSALNATLATPPLSAPVIV